MGENSSIEWCNDTWNPWTGCRHVSAGCAHCYMFTDMRRYGRDPDAITRTKTWGAPLKWNRKAKAEGIRKRVFTCSWSDFFIEEADPWRSEAWGIIDRCEWLDFQILTKRPERMAGRLSSFPRHLFDLDGEGPGPNVWLGVSVENRKQGLPRIDILRDTPAAVRFLSIEPLLEDLGEIDLEGIDWVIVGGESGPGARPMHPDWARSIRDQCLAAKVKFFFKQWGQWVVLDQMTEDLRSSLDASGSRLYTDPDDGRPWRMSKAGAGRELDGRIWEEMPSCRA